MDVSVIVPIYNAETFLEKCLDSIIGQSHQNMEIILVDDGSSDRSGKICDGYVGKDSRIRVVHKENEGLICARMTGLEMTKYENVVFVDADDWVEKDYLEQMVCEMERTEADIVISGCIYERNGGSDCRTNEFQPGVYENEQLTETLFSKMLHYQGFYKFGILPYMWNKLFRRQILRKCYEGIDTGIYDGEDAAVVYPYLLLSKKAAVISKCLYHYRIHPDSMTYKKKNNYYENISRLYLHLQKACLGSGHYEKMLPQLDQYMRRMAWLGDPDCFLEAEENFFPFRHITAGTDIILYGAGRVGKIFYHQVKRTDYCNIVSWVDKNYLAIPETEMIIESPEIIPVKPYDYLVIAAADKKVQKEIIQELQRYGVPEKKMVCSA